MALDRWEYDLRDINVFRRDSVIYVIDTYNLRAIKLLTRTNVMCNYQLNFLSNFLFFFMYKYFEISFVKYDSFSW